MHSTSVLDSAYSWKRLALTLAIAMIANVGMWAVVVIMPEVQQEFAIARATASLPYTFTMIGFGLGHLVIGPAVDRFGVTAALVGAALALGAGFALAAISSSIHMLYAVQLLVGLATASGFGPLLADISHWFLKRRGVAVAIVASGNYLSGAIWPTLLHGIQTAGGWRTVYMWLAVIAVAAIIPLALTLRRRVPAEASAFANSISRANATSGSFSPRTLQWLLALAGIGCCVAMSMPQVHLVSLTVDRGYGAATGAEMLSVMLLGGVASRLASGFIADRIGGVATLLLGSTLQCLALFLYLPADTLSSLYAVSLVFGLSQGGIVPSYALVVREYMPAGEAGRRIGFVIMATIVGMALGGWLSGFIYDLTGSYEMAFVNGIGFNMMNMAVIGFILLRTRRATPLPA